MIDRLLFALTFISALSCGLMAGVFFSRGRGIAHHCALFHAERSSGLIAPKGGILALSTYRLRPLELGIDASPRWK